MSIKNTPWIPGQNRKDVPRPAPRQEESRIEPLREAPRTHQPALSQTLFDRLQSASHSNFTLLLLVLVVIALVFVTATPSMNGLAVYERQLDQREDLLSGKETELNKAAAEYSVIEEKLANCEDLNTKTFENMQAASNEAAAISGKLAIADEKLTAQKLDCEKQVADTELFWVDESSSKESEITNLQTKFDSFAGNLAKNICCKAKIDNIAINGYLVENNNLKCVETGGLELTC